MKDDLQTYESAISMVGLLAAFSMTVISLYLTRRATRADNVLRANFILGACVIGWTCNGMLACLMDFIPVRSVMQEQIYQITQVLEEMFALLWMVPTLTLWSEVLAIRGFRKLIFSLQATVIITSVALFLLYLVETFHPELKAVPEYRKFLFRTGFVALNLPPIAAGYIALHRRGITPVTRLALGMMLTGTIGLTLASAISNFDGVTAFVKTMLDAVMVWCPLVIITGGIVLFARFRFADRFIRYCVRIFSAATIGIIAPTLLAGFIGPMMSAFAMMNPGLALALAGILIALFVGLYARSEASLDKAVSRLIFPAPDYDRLVVSLQQDLVRLDDEAMAIHTASDFIATTLQIERVDAIRISREDCASLSIPFINSTAPVTIDHRHAPSAALFGVEILVPFRFSEDFLEALALKANTGRRGLVTHEMKFLGVVGSQLASRLQSIRHQGDIIESRSREALLKQQLTSAELDALRAQINPHFLFNALNTLADLIRVDAVSAETMTLRLAQVFRYVLAHSNRPMVQVREEMDFLRSYLDIEEARFGDRLRVDFQVDPEVNTCPIPSLILQPLVENALKHGLSPNPGPGHLWIKAFLKDGLLHITIEDDGVGLPQSRPGHLPKYSGHGVGLENTRRRLETQYPGQAGFTLESRDTAGVIAKLTLPPNP